MTRGFTVLTVTHESAAPLERLLDSLERHLDPPPPVVVVDNASSDTGAELARSRGADVIVLSENVGFGAANNVGLARVTTPVTVLLNPDVELLDGGLSELARVASVRAALVVPRLLRPDGSVQDSAHPPPGTLQAFLPALLPAPLLPSGLRRRAEPWRSDRPGTVGWAIAACLAAGTELLSQLGPFDSGTFLFFEDLDLCLRAQARGIPTLLEPRIVLRHAGAHSTGRRYGGDPHELLARRRREVIGTRLGPHALRLDDAAQAITFMTRAAGRALRRGDWSVQAARLRALRAARRSEEP
jgi:GT2 family glycosyltransferase